MSPGRPPTAGGSGEWRETTSGVRPAPRPAIGTGRGESARATISPKQSEPALVLALLRQELAIEQANSSHEQVEQEEHDGGEHEAIP